MCLPGTALFYPVEKTYTANHICKNRNSCIARLMVKVLVFLTVLNTDGLYLQTELTLFLVTKKDPESGDIIGVQFLLWKHSATPGRHELIYR